MNDWDEDSSPIPAAPLAHDGVAEAYEATSGAPLASTDPPNEPLFCRKCGGHAGHYSDCPEVERALASTDPTPPARRRDKWRTRKPFIAETEECHHCKKPAPLVPVDEEVTWGSQVEGFAATPVKVQSWFYRCDCGHEWYTHAASQVHEATVWRATMEAMSDIILTLRAETAALRQDRDRLDWLETRVRHDTAQSLAEADLEGAALEANLYLSWDAGVSLRAEIDAARAAPPQEDANAHVARDE
ncbi:MAG: hypothetical protein V4529_16740 [Gemmatimonadota bacterium]